MPTLMSWPILTLRLEGGPDDGALRLMPAMVSRGAAGAAGAVSGERRGLREAS